MWFKQLGGGQFWLKRIAKVWIPWFILISIVSVVSKKDLIDYIRDVSWFGASLWYVRYIFYCYIVFYVTSFIPKPTYRVCAIAVVAVASIVLLQYEEGEQWASFLLGVLLSEYKSTFARHNAINRKYNWIIFILGVGFLALKQTGWYRGLEVDDTIVSSCLVNIIQSIVKVSFAAFIINWMILHKTTRKIHLLVFLGGISYELYLVQMFFYGQVNNSASTAFAVMLGSVFIACFFNVINELISSKMLLKEYK